MISSDLNIWWLIFRQVWVCTAGLSYQIHMEQQLILRCFHVGQIAVQISKSTHRNGKEGQWWRKTHLPPVISRCGGIVVIIKVVKSFIFYKHFSSTLMKNVTCVSMALIKGVTLYLKHPSIVECHFISNSINLSVHYYEIYEFIFVKCFTMEDHVCRNVSERLYLNKNFFKIIRWAPVVSLFDTKSASQILRPVCPYHVVWCRL